MTIVKKLFIVPIFALLAIIANTIVVPAVQGAMPVAGASEKGGGDIRECIDANVGRWWVGNEGEFNYNVILPGPSDVLVEWFTYDEYDPGQGDRANTPAQIHEKIQMLANGVYRDTSSELTDGVSRAEGKGSFEGQFTNVLELKFLHHSDSPPSSPNSVGLERVCVTYSPIDRPDFTCAVEVDSKVLSTDEASMGVTLRVTVDGDFGNKLPAVDVNWGDGSVETYSGDSPSSYDYAHTYVNLGDEAQEFPISVSYSQHFGWDNDIGFGLQTRTCETSVSYSPPASPTTTEAPVTTTTMSAPTTTITEEPPPTTTTTIVIPPIMEMEHDPPIVGTPMFTG